LVKYLQQVGRGLRPTQGKTRCVILDNVGLHLTFGLPDDNRDWITDFEGDPSFRLPKPSTGGRKITKEPQTESFDEGAAELCLIKRVEKQWTESDDELLLRLYSEKQCPIEVLASVFKRQNEDISTRIEYLQNK
jgi:superfamily II DNA or RNA helicase